MAFLIEKTRFFEIGNLSPKSVSWTSGLNTEAGFPFRKCTPEALKSEDTCRSHAFWTTTTHGINTPKVRNLPQLLPKRRFKVGLVNAV